MRVTISNDVNTDAETFWSRIFFDPEYNQALYKSLGFPEAEVLEQRDDGGAIIRRVRVVPKNDAPAPIRKLVGDRFSYVEEGRFDKATKRFQFRVVTSAMADKIKTEGEMRAEVVGPKLMKRVTEMTIDVKIFGIGGMVEGFVSKSTQDSYAQAAAFTNRWIAEKGL